MARGRPKGFKMSEEQKAALKAGRDAARAEKIAAGIVPVVKEKNPSGRTMSEEHKAKIAEGRRLARERKIANGEPLRVSRKKKGTLISDSGKPVMLITGKEKDAFDFYSLIRDTLRPLKLGAEAEKIIREITNRQWWQNIVWIQNALSKYVELQKEGD